MMTFLPAALYHGFQPHKISRTLAKLMKKKYFDSEERDKEK